MDEGVFVGGAPPHIDAFESKLIINNDVLLDTENEVNTAVNLQDLAEVNAGKHNSESHVTTTTDSTTTTTSAHVVTKHSGEFIVSCPPLARFRTISN
ncbi:hypothetical protein ANCCAN_20767 [Ancylostoma caninum]|uniref:Uncharacterized protein n=1 Tax=Ancylostoma caninum TaxID=29170 RepID=A0A368FMD6_ANCCA|nr:hypothetical protein ANCCAN_20767 [Ancylostoma caninum]